MAPVMHKLPACFLAACLALLAAAPARAADTLYDTIGGRPVLVRIVDNLTTLWITDTRVSADFDNINMDYLKPRLVDMLCVVADGPCQYKGRSMAASHKGLKLTQAKFNAVAEDLQTAMDQAGVPYRVQNRLIARLAPLERDIVTK